MRLSSGDVGESMNVGFGGEMDEIRASRAGIRKEV